MTDGSSPRLRGTRKTKQHASDRRRFIPAPAGNTNVFRACRHRQPVHPRACGEHSRQEQGSLRGPELDEDGEPATALLRAARASPNKKVLADLLAEAERVKREIAREREANEARLADAADALARGENIDPVTALLLRAKAVNAAEEARRTSPQAQPARKQIEARVDFIVDATGNASAAPAPSVESTAQTPAPTSPPEPEKLPPKAPPFQVDPEPPPPKAPAKPAHPGANMPGFSEHLALKAKEKAEQERIEALRKMYPNQVPADVAFGIPDPQPGPEIVTFGRIPGSKGIRRVS